MKCPYCNGEAVLRNSSYIYGTNKYGYLYVCENFPTCDSYVGTHKKSKKAFGRLADKELRRLKKNAHKYFDSIWRYRQKQGLANARNKAYEWLSRELKIEKKDTHIGMFDTQLTLKVIKLCKPYYEKIYRIKEHI